LEAQPEKLCVRNQLQWPRKIWHAGMGSIIVAIYALGCPRPLAITLLAMAFLGFILIETARLKLPTLNSAMVKLWGPLMRKSEVNRYSGVPFYLASSTLAVAIFPKPIAVLSILFLAFGDPTASVVGITYGKKGPKFANGKTLIGTVAGGSVCALIALIYASTLPISIWGMLGFALAGGIAGGSAELLPFEMDDNFTIPIVSGFVLWFCSLFLGV
jgi:diacylglycerol kinase (CTP)